MIYAILLRLILTCVFGSVHCLSQTCSLQKCDATITPRHAAQISLIQEAGIVESDCLRRLRRIDTPEIAAVYCPEEKICGLDLEPNFTGELQILTNISCSVYAKSEETCNLFDAQIPASGEYFSVRS